MNVHEISAGLEADGFNLFAVLGRDAICAIPGLQGWGALILVGNAGPLMWRKIPPRYFERKHPVDDFARDSVAGLMQRFAGGAAWELLFPGSDCPPLQLLGKMAGWHADSPLGCGINADSGLWFAYRAVVATDSDLPGILAEHSESPCLACESRACVQGCPAQAVSYASPPDMQRCGTYRLQSTSPCADTCLARQCCPVAPQMRYDRAQISYHYRQALPALSQWLDRPITERQTDV